MTANHLRRHRNSHFTLIIRSCGRIPRAFMFNFSGGKFQVSELKFYWLWNVFQLQFRVWVELLLCKFQFFARNSCCPFLLAPFLRGFLIFITVGKFALNEPILKFFFSRVSRDSSFSWRSRLMTRKEMLGLRRVTAPPPSQLNRLSHTYCNSYTYIRTIKLVVPLFSNNRKRRSRPTSRPRRNGNIFSSFFCSKSLNHLLTPFSESHSKTHLYGFNIQ